MSKISALTLCTLVVALATGGNAAAIGSRNVAMKPRACHSKGDATPSASILSDVPSATGSPALNLNQAAVSPVKDAQPAKSSTVISVQAPSETGSSAINTGGGANGAGMALNDKSGSNWSEWASSGLSWYYDWSAGPLTALKVPASWEFVPMLWGRDAAAFTQAKASFAQQKVTHLLSFNEPDIATAFGGSEISVADGVTLHKASFDDALASMYKIGAPAVSNGASGKKWLQDWIAACNGACYFDFIPIHYYGKDVSGLESYINDMAKTFQKPLWLTEFGCKTYSPDYICTADESAAFMKEAVTLLKRTSVVERWSWLGAMPSMASSGDSTGMSNADGSPNALGKTYMGLA